MSAAEYLADYAKGWSMGDASTILRSASQDYVFDDPNVGKISRDEFADYLAQMKETVRSQLGGKLPEMFMELSEVVTLEEDGAVTAWCWWAIPGTAIRGSGLIKVGSEGVRSEVITYYTKLSS